MRALILFLLAFNSSIEAARVYDISFYKVKEIKLKKIDKQTVTNLAILTRDTL